MIVPMLKPGTLFLFLKADRHSLERFLFDESGQDVMEYGLAALLLSLCAVAALNGVSSGVVRLWAGLVTSYSNAM